MIKKLEWDTKFFEKKIGTLIFDEISENGLAKDLEEATNDNYKYIVCKLKSNPMGIKSVAYPIDEVRLPDWFKELPFDHIAMEETIIDKKIGNLLNVMKWDLKQGTSRSTFDDLFEL